LNAPSDPPMRRVLMPGWPRPARSRKSGDDDYEQMSGQQRRSPVSRRECCVDPNAMLKTPVKHVVESAEHCHAASAAPACVLMLKSTYGPAGMIPFINEGH